MAFSDIKGQDCAITFLKAAIRNRRLSHAYIFAGPRGCGRSFLARNFAKALNCIGEKEAPCDSCISCKKIDKDIHPDVKWIRKDEKGNQIKISQIRELESQIFLKPYEGRYKIFVIAEAELMNSEAANSFLKTLEEPPPNSLLILIAERPKDLLPTLASRCQLIRLRPLEANSIPDDRDDILEEFSGDECIEDYSGANRGELSKKLNVLAGWYRDLMIFKVTGDKNLLINFDRFDYIKNKAPSHDTGELINIFENILDAKEKIESNMNPKLVLSAMFKEIG